MLWFFLFVIWIWILITIFSDIIRSHDLHGGGKALWTIFIILVPFLGCFIYLIARGNKMQERAIEDAKKRDAQMRDYVQSVSTGGTAADELAKLADLHDKGVLTDDEYAAAKAKALG